MHDDKLITETKRELMAKGVQYCFATYVDVHGVPKAKTCPIASFEKMARGSELFTVGAMEGMGLVGPQEDECAAVPDLGFSHPVWQPGAGRRHRPPPDRLTHGGILGRHLVDGTQQPGSPHGLDVRLQPGALRLLFAERILVSAALYRDRPAW